MNLQRSLQGMTSRSTKLRYRQQLGLSLVELMVSMLMGMILMLALLQVTLSSRQAFMLERENAGLQENARFAVEIIRRELQRAGDTGCRPDVNVLNFVAGSGDGDPGDGSDAPQLQGWDDAEADTEFPAEYRADKLADTDSIFISGIDEMNRFQVTTDIVIGILRRNITLTPEDPTQTSFADDIDSGDVVLMSSPSCESVLQFKISSSDDITSTITVEQPENCAVDFDKVFAADPTVVSDCANPASILDLVAGNLANYYINKVVGVRFYLAPSGVDSAIPALWRSYTESGNDDFEEQEMVQGVENMQLQYGIDTDSPSDGIPDRYANANDADLATVADWTNVKSIKVNLLMRSLNPVLYNDEANADFEGIAVPTDRHLRQRLSFVVYLRNQAAL